MLAITHLTDPEVIEKVEVFHMLFRGLFRHRAPRAHVKASFFSCELGTAIRLPSEHTYTTYMLGKDVDPGLEVVVEQGCSEGVPVCPGPGCPLLAACWPTGVVHGDAVVM